jgi:hypothetical protein
MLALNKNPAAAELRSFGWSTLLGFGVIGTMLWYSSIAHTGSWWPRADWGWAGHPRQILALIAWTAGLTVFATSRFSRRLARSIYLLWMTGAMYAGMVTTFIMLTVLFVTVLPAFSLIRLADPLRLKVRQTGSYWEQSSPHETTLERMRRPF